MKPKLCRIELEFLILVSNSLDTYNDARFNRERYILDRVCFVNFNLQSQWSKSYGGYGLLFKSVNGYCQIQSQFISSLILCLHLGSGLPINAPPKEGMKRPAELI